MLEHNRHCGFPLLPTPEVSAMWTVPLGLRTGTVGLPLWLGLPALQALASSTTCLSSFRRNVHHTPGATTPIVKYPYNEHPTSTAVSTIPGWSLKYLKPLHCSWKQWVSLIPLQPTLSTKSLNTTKEAPGR